LTANLARRLARRPGEPEAVAQVPDAAGAAAAQAGGRVDQRRRGMAERGPAPGSGASAASGNTAVCEAREWVHADPE
jgi:hypothetical protein